MILRSLVAFFFILFFFCEFGFCRAGGTADQLSVRAMELFDRGWYRESIDVFEELNERYPFSDYDDIACLRIADAHFELGHYQEAVGMYEHFELMYPRNDCLAYVFYRTASAYLSQTRHFDNDQNYTNIALTNYLKLLRKFPESEYAYKARTDLDVCYEKLSSHEFSIGIFYYNKGKYSSALSRFVKIISLYPDVGYHRMALLYLLECEYLTH